MLYCLVDKTSESVLGVALIGFIITLRPSITIIISKVTI